MSSLKYYHATEDLTNLKMAYAGGLICDQIQQSNPSKFDG